MPRPPHPPHSGPSPTAEGGAVGQTLFRQEVIAHRPTGVQGEILLAHYRFSRWMATLAVLCVVSVVALFAWGSYTKRATAAGFITPAGGVAKLHPPLPGFVAEVLVSEGMRVKAGDKLFIISTDRQTGDQKPYQQSIVESIRARAQLIDFQVQSAEVAATSEREAQRNRRDSIVREITNVRAQLVELRARERKARQDASVYKGLLSQGIVTRDQISAKDVIAGDLTNRIAALEREEISLAREAEALQKGLQASAARQVAASQALEREAAAVREQLAEAESRRQIIISAPRAGTVTLVQATPGSFVDSSRPIATISDADAPLQATVYADGRAVAQLQAGLKAHVRVAALPHEKHGTLPARVLTVSRLPATTQDRLEAIGNIDRQGEPLYSVTLALDHPKHLVEVGKAALRAGMRVDADFLLERRTLWQWTMEPLLAARRRMTSS